MMGTDEDELLARWRQGERRAADELARAHESCVRRFFATKVEAQVVDDLVQRTFVECARSISGFRGDSSFRTFLLVIARRQLYRDIESRRRRRRHELDPKAHSLHELVESPADDLAVAADRRRLLRALRRIPLELQIALELYYWEGLSTAEIGAILELPRGTIKSRLRRAREALEAEMSRHAAGETSTTTRRGFGAWVRSIRRRLEG